MAYVIKRGGRKQTFMPSKIKNSIEMAAKAAGVAKAKRDEFAKEISQAVAAKYKARKLVKISEIRSAVVERLGRRSKAALASWKKQEKKKRKKKE